MSDILEFSGRSRFLCNFYPAPVTLDGWEYPTVEHAFQAAKTEDAAERARIRLASEPGHAKFLGRRVALRPGWDGMRVGVMRALLAQKFEPGTNLRASLDATAPGLLEEGNDWDDRFWGKVNGVGENWLGRLLMELRDVVVADGR